METRKAHIRRLKSGFYAKYIQGYGIDIGCGRLETGDGVDPISLDNCVHHDKDMCDATTMDIFEENTFDYVYASHVMEHLLLPVTALKNWVRICKPGGWVIISVPHRDLYERRIAMPSRWNPDHKFFILPDRDELPHTFSMARMLSAAGINDYVMTVQNTCTNVDKPHEHGDGEFSIEVIFQKNA